MFQADGTACEEYSKELGMLEARPVELELREEEGQVGGGQVLQGLVVNVLLISF